MNTLCRTGFLARPFPGDSLGTSSYAVKKGSVMITRRTFVGSMGAMGALGTAAIAAQEPAPARRRRMAVVTTVWRDRSHAWHMAERFLHGYPIQGRWHRPPFDVVSAYVDQQPEGDLSKRRSEEFGFKIFPTVAEALRCGGDKLAVDCVLLIGEQIGRA